MKTIPKLLCASSAVALALTVNGCDSNNSTSNQDLGGGGDMAVALGPTVSAVTPATGPTTGGAMITISGADFATGATVTIGGTPCQNVAVVSPTQITCTTPPRPMMCGAVDVVVTNPDQGAGTGTGAFTYTRVGVGFAMGTPFATTTAPSRLTLADMNKDMRLDAVTANGANGVSLLLGNGMGGFGTATNLVYMNVNVNHAVLADINKDGNPDLVTAQTAAAGGNASIGLRTGMGNGMFSMTVTSTNAPVGTTTPPALVVGDFNNDMNPDVVTINAGQGTVTRYLGDGMGGFPTVANFTAGGAGTNPQWIAAADFNKDTFLDVVTANLNNASVSVLPGGAMGFGTAQTLPMGTLPIYVAVADPSGNEAPSHPTYTRLRRQPSGSPRRRHTP